MITINKHGNHKESLEDKYKKYDIEYGRLYTTKCDKCGCEFNYTAEDIKITQWPHVGEGCPVEAFVTCPECFMHLINHKERYHWTDKRWDE